MTITDVVKYYRKRNQLAMEFGEMTNSQRNSRQGDRVMRQHAKYVGLLNSTDTLELFGCMVEDMEHQCAREFEGNWARFGEYYIARAIDHQDDGTTRSHRYLNRRSFSRLLLEA